MCESDEMRVMGAPFLARFLREKRRLLFQSNVNLIPTERESRYSGWVFRLRNQSLRHGRGCRPLLTCQ